MEGPKFTVSVSSDVPYRQLNSLRSVLADTAVVQEEKQRVFTGVEWAAIVVILKVTGAGAVAAGSILALARQINSWRNDAKRNVSGLPAFFQRPNQPELNLATATDGEVRDWLVAAAAGKEVPEWMATATDEQVRVWLKRQLNQE